jgi:tyrosine-protein phosphatase SIW14
LSATDTTLPTLEPARLRRRARRWLLAILAFDLLALVVIAAVLASAWWPKRLSEVEPGVLYRSAQRHGIKTVVIARDGASERIADEKRAAREAGVTVIQLPIVSGAELRDEDIRAFFDAVDDPAQRPVLVHCAAGRHRTGLLCALYRIRRQGWDAAQAREEMLSFGFDEAGHRELLRQFDRLTGGIQTTGGVAADTPER